MAITWKQLTKIVGRRAGRQPNNADESSHPANVLLQIMLPIVLILAFIMIVRMQALERTRQDFEGLINKFKNEDRGTVLEQYTKALMELQKQILIVELQKIKDERREYFGIDLFSAINLGPKGNSLAKQRFRGICERTVKHLGNERAKSEQVASIYQAVLDSANIEDRRPTDLESNYGILRYFGIITSENKEYILKQIVEFTNQLTVDAQRSQYEVIRATSEFYGSHPESLDDLNPRIRQLREDYRDEPTPVIAREMHNCIVNTLAEYLQNQGFLFFRDTWRNLARGYE
jgi:hypothetical protein